MDWRAQCAAVIPCLNEARMIGPLLQAVLPHLPTVIVIDDGSSDDTAIIAQKAGAEVLRLPSTMGKGTALQTGWRHVHARGFRWALSLDGDGQHAPEEIPKFFRSAEQTSAALVIGDRMAESASMPWLRLAVNRWMSRWLSTAAGQALPDSQCGFRLMDLGVWASLPITSAHFEIESDVLLAFVRAGQKVEFVPIRTIYKQEQSKIHPVRDTIRWLAWLWKVRSKRSELRRPP